LIPDRSFRAAERKVKRRSQLIEIVNQAKEAGKEVVFTNGCFDILHIGHIRYLQDARSLGDMLVVGINADATVRKLKGPERPVNSVLERTEVLAALECVDYVTIFEEDTPVELITAIKPTLHVKGGDYKPEDLPEANAVRAIGGKVHVITYSVTDTEGYSTTEVISRIMQG